MEECPNCGKFSMWYSMVHEEWTCFNCSYRIIESRDNYNRRLLENNKIGKHYVSPPIETYNPSWRTCK